MKVRLLDPGSPRSFAPLTLTRRLHECPIGGVPLGELASLQLSASGLEVVASSASSDLTVAGDAWLSSGTLVRLQREKARTFVLQDSSGAALAWSGGADRPANGAHILEAGLDDIHLQYPWDLLRINELVVGSLTENRIEGELSDQVRIDGILHLGQGSVLLPGVYIEGHAVVGRDCKIGPNCYLRGSTSIGDRCRIGQAVEVKNSILFSHISIGHLSYCGDSIIGSGVNFGAGTIVANLRHDGRNQRSEVEGALRDTGRRKLGTIVGDNVHTGIHTSIYPGRKLWPDTWTRPGEIVQRDLRTHRPT